MEDTRRRDKREDLLECIRERMELRYISDLTMTPSISYFRACCYSMDVYSFPINQWKEACEYIFESKFEFQTYDDIKAFIKG